MNLAGEQDGVDAGQETDRTADASTDEGNDGGLDEGGVDADGGSVESVDADGLDSGAEDVTSAEDGLRAEDGDSGEDGFDDVGPAPECLYDEECAEGYLCLEPSGEFPATEATVRTCQPFDGTLEGGPVVGRTGCEELNLVDVDVWGFCDSVSLRVRDGDVIRGTVCGPDRKPAFRYSVPENRRVEFYLSRADESLGVIFIGIHRGDCSPLGSSGGIPLEYEPHHGPLELGFEGPGDYTLVFEGTDRPDVGTGSFTFHLTERGTF